MAPLAVTVETKSSKREYANLQGLERAMLILEQLADGPRSAKDLANSLGLKWTTAHRTLTYLRDEGYLSRDDATRLYYIGSRLYYIGSSYVANLPILHAARVYLKAAADETGATAQLVERDDRRSIVLAVFEPKSEYIPKTTIGYHFPIHCGSKGQVLLAFAGSAFIDSYLERPLDALTSYTITDPGELRRRLADIRAHDYAATKRDVQLSTASVAAPVRDSSGEVIASVTLIANYAEFESLEARLIDVIVNTARSISVLMGWRPQLATRSTARSSR